MTVYKIYNYASQDEKVNLISNFKVEGDGLVGSGRNFSYLPFPLCTAQNSGTGAYWWSVWCFLFVFFSFE